MESFKQLKSLGLFLGVILLIMGIVLLLFPTKVIQIVATVVGVAVLIFGASRCLNTAIKWKDQESTHKGLKLVCGFILVGLGVYILLNTGITVSAVGVVIGLFAIISSFDRLSVALERRKSGQKIGSSLLFGFIHLAFGIGMIYAAFGMISIIVMLAGIYLMVSGIMVILSACYFLDF